MKTIGNNKIITFKLLLSSISVMFFCSGCSTEKEAEVKSIFKSEASRQAFYATYDQSMTAWAIPYEPLDIQTSYGKIHINVCGPKDKPPLILLPVMTFTSVLWYPNVCELSKYFHVFAVDIIGDHGKSEASRRITDRKEFADWLCEVMDSLKIDKADVAGESYGGFIALNTAYYRPDRIRKVIAIAPAPSIINFKITGRILVKLIRVIPSLIPKDPGKAFPMFCEYPDKMDTRLKEIYFAVMRDGQSSLLIDPTPFSRQELKGFRIPVLVMMGEKDPIYNCDKGLKRARTFIPQVRTIKVLNAKHFVNVDQTEIVDKNIIEFLAY